MNATFFMRRLAMAPAAIAAICLAAGPVRAADAGRPASDPTPEFAQRGDGMDGSERRRRGGNGSEGGGPGAGEESEQPQAPASGGPPAGKTQNRAARMLRKNDSNGDGRLSAEAWPRSPEAFKMIDTNKDGILAKEELQAWFASPDRRRGGGAGGGRATGPMLDGQMAPSALDEETRCGITRSKKCDIKIAIKRGLFETGLEPVFPEGLDCREIDSEKWAISYTDKRPREGYHGGIDMPAPFGTPMIAAAAGTVVAKSNREESFRGIEIILRHSPDDTGLPVWTYTQYAHFDEMPKLALGERVRMGQTLGPTGNSGRTMDTTGFSGKQRRPAIHFAVWLSQSPSFANVRDIIVPVNGWWMDPNAFYRKGPPFDSTAMKALPESEKKVPVPVMMEDGTTVPADTKVVWPYTCARG